MTMSFVPSPRGNLGRKEGRTEGRKDRRTDGRKDRQTEGKKEGRNTERR